MKKMICIICLLLLPISTISGCTKSEKDPTTNKNNNDIISSEKVNPVSDFEYEENDENGITITQYIGNESSVIIPSKIENKNVTQIGHRAFMRRAVTSVEMPNSVTKIQALAFSECLELTSVTLSNKLEHIGDSAFENCTNLSDITLPNSLTCLSYRAFANCYLLKHINIPANCFDRYEYSDEVFFHSGLQTIVFEEGLEIIPQHAFAGTNITELVFPKSIKKIAWCAFAGCEKLEKVILNDGIITLESDIFARTKIKEIIIPSSVESITEMTFNQCSVLEKVKFEGNAPESYFVEYNIPELPDPKPYDVHYTIYYHIDAKGFSSPNWNGYPSEIW